MSHDPQQPLLTTSPLRPSFTCPFTMSPNPHKSAPTDTLTFVKLPVPNKLPLSAASTDSETHSSDWVNDSCPGRSPSLLTSLFQSRQSSADSTSPRTPVLFEGSCGKPILRRDTCDDVGLGIITALEEAPPMNRKKSCLKFAVAPCTSTSDSAVSPHSSYTQQRQASRLPSLPEPEEYFEPSLPVLESESDDEGYEEDEEGGFTSDEEEMGEEIFRRMVPHRASPNTSSIYRKVDAGPSRPAPGRKISIAATIPCAERCTRHCSPPPSTTLDPLVPIAPPVAQSPSARELCRRRGSGSERPSRGCRFSSDDVACVSILQTTPRKPTQSHGAESSQPSLVSLEGSNPTCALGAKSDVTSEMCLSSEGEAKRGLESVLRISS